MSAFTPVVGLSGQVMQDATRSRRKARVIGIGRVRPDDDPVDHSEALLTGWFRW